jgi:hypothetical protein
VPGTVKVLAKNGAAADGMNAWVAATVGEEALDGMQLEWDLTGPGITAADVFKKR